jgi:hypothetical protein
MTCALMGKQRQAMGPEWSVTTDHKGLVNPVGKSQLHPEDHDELTNFLSLCFAFFFM